MSASDNVLSNVRLAKLNAALQTLRAIAAQDWEDDAQAAAAAQSMRADARQTLARFENGNAE